MNSDLLADGISVVVPVFNSEQSLLPLCQRLESVLAATGQPFEVVLVNDCSHDRSWDVICDISRSLPWCSGINLMRNYGQHSALLCGIRTAAYVVTVTMDDDLQNPPEEIPKLLAKLSEGYDCVYGRPANYRHSLFRNVATQVTKICLQHGMGAEAASNIGPFRAFRTRLRDAFADFKSSYVSVDALLTWGAGKFVAVDVRHEPRTLGATNYTIGKLVTHTMNMMTGFSTLPLRFASVVGLGSAGVGGCLLFYVISKHLILGGEVPGFSFLASALLLFSGVQLAALGVMGEYVARMFTRVLEQPTYMVLETTATVPTPTGEREGRT